MHCVTWTYRTSPELTPEKIRQLFNEVAHRYTNVPGLIRKYFGYSEDGRAVVGIYLWADRQHAEAFYSPDWIAGVTERWGATPQRVDWIVPVVAEHEKGVVTDA